MNGLRKCTGWLAWSFTLALTLFLGPGAARADSIVWDKAGKTVTADVQSLDVVSVLRKVARHTGWEVFLQPGTKQVVPTRFRKLSEGDALARLLGNLSFVVVPQTNGPSKLFVFRTARQDATELIAAEAAAKAKPIENELIAVLKPGESIDELAKRLGAEVTGRLDSLNAYRLKFKDAESAKKAREALRNESSVASVDYNYSVPRPQPVDAFSAAGARFALNPKAPTDGKYTVVGLIDSAVQGGAGRFGQFLLDPISIAGETQVPTDQPTHGTAMAETILNGLAKAAGKDGSTAVRILPVDVYGNNEMTSTFDVAAGISRAVEGGARVINLSMAGDGDTWVLREVIRNAHTQGIVFFAAPGNDGSSNPTFPASYPEVIAVTALDRQGGLANYANYGNYVRAAAPGTATVTFNDQSFVITGTSAATAYASGIAARIAESTGRSASQVEAMIQALLAVPQNATAAPR